jgi:hypothetical protein
MTGSDVVASAPRYQGEAKYVQLGRTGTDGRRALPPAAGPSVGDWPMCTGSDVVSSDGALPGDEIISKPTRLPGRVQSVLCR